jgi:endonuclease/exonuclease/phosphatase family metal-dependent hydrolase/regulation of enolase protein 1 (concanavalin A-like superfamily)
MSRFSTKVTFVVSALLCLIPVAASAQSLRIVTWNIRHGYEGGPTESVKNVDGQTTLLASLNPQIVVLNEVLSVPTNDVATYESQLEAKTGAQWYSHYVRGNKGCACDGNMLLSRIPFDATPTILRMDDPAWQYDRSVIHAQITFNAVQLHVFATHLSFENNGERRTQIDQATNFMAQYTTGPRIIGGDFNMEPSNADYSYFLQKGYTDMWVDRWGSAPHPATHQSGAALDYWLRSTAQASSVVPTDVFVQATTLSDHRPVVGVLNVQGSGGLPTPWVSQNVGSVGVAGSASYASGTFTINGSGADIWGTADSFRYVYQTLNGDGTIVARVTGIENTSPFSKAGVMIRETLNANSAHAMLDVKPDGTLEFMKRSTAGGSTTYLGGGAQSPPTWIKLTRAGSQFTAYMSANGTTWTQVGTTTLSIAATALIGVVVCAHDNTTLNTSTFDNVNATGNLLQKGGFEEYVPPALGTPGWVSDSVRQTPAKSETNQPRTGTKNGVCSTPSALDCGMYQEVTAPSTGTYTLTFFANADRTGGLVGANVNGASAASANVQTRGFGNYGSAYTMTFSASAGATIRVWMYSPAIPGYVVIDDVSLLGP